MRVERIRKRRTIHDPPLDLGEKKESQPLGDEIRPGDSDAFMVDVREDFRGRDSRDVDDACVFLESVYQAWEDGRVHTVDEGHVCSAGLSVDETLFRKKERRTSAEKLDDRLFREHPERPDQPVAENVLEVLAAALDLEHRLNLVRVWRQPHLFLERECLTKEEDRGVGFFKPHWKKKRQLATGELATRKLAYEGRITE